MGVCSLLPLLLCEVWELNSGFQTCIQVPLTGLSPVFGLGASDNGYYWAVDSYGNTVIHTAPHRLKQSCFCSYQSFYLIVIGDDSTEFNLKLQSGLSQGFPRPTCPGTTICSCKLAPDVCTLVGPFSCSGLKAPTCLCISVMERASGCLFGQRVGQ